METVTRSLLQWGAATLALAGQAESGDQHVVQAVPRGMLVAVVDGLGHGEEAAAAAQLAVEEVKRSRLESVISLVNRCHEALRGTRGVVMSVAFFNRLEDTMTWLGVGNVDGLLLRAEPVGKRARESLVLRGGVVGGRLPALHASIVPVVPGDTLILVTDGIASGFGEAVSLRDSPQRIADRILAQHSRGTDDALVLVARYVGKAS